MESNYVVLKFLNSLEIVYAWISVRNGFVYTTFKCQGKLHNTCHVLVTLTNYVNVQP